MMPDMTRNMTSSPISHNADKECIQRNSRRLQVLWAVCVSQILLCSITGHHKSLNFLALTHHLLIPLLLCLHLSPVP